MDEDTFEDTPYFILPIKKEVSILPSQLNRNMEESLLKNIKKKIEGKCINEGYVRKNSLIIIDRTMAYKKGEHFNGQMTCLLHCICDICFPPQGERFICEVKTINKMGLLAVNGPINVYVTRQQEQNEDFFNQGIEPNMEIEIEVIKSKCTPGDDKIIVLGAIKNIIDDTQLNQLPHKNIKLNIGNINTEVFNLVKNNSPPEPKVIYGYNSYVDFVRNDYHNIQKDAEKMCLEKFKNGSKKKPKNMSIEDAATRECSMMIRLARSLTNQFEVVHPPSFYTESLVNDYNKPRDRAFFKMWEMIEDFNLLPKKSDIEIITTAHLAEAPGSFVEATLKWREQGSSNKNVTDKIFGISLKDESEESPGIPVEKMESVLSKDYPNFTAIYGGESKHPIPAGYKKRQGDGTGDLYKIGNILDFAADVQKAGGGYLVTSDLGFEFDNVEDVREQAFQFPLFAQIVGVLSCQAFGGNCVIKLFTTFTDITAKLIYYISQFYQESYMSKPYTSRTGTSEKYLICKNFEGISKEQLSNLYESFENWKSIETFSGANYKDNKEYVVDITNINNRSAIKDIEQFNKENIRQRQIKVLKRINKFIKDMPDIDTQSDIKNRQITLARKWFNHYNFDCN